MKRTNLRRTGLACVCTLLLASCDDRGDSSLSPDVPPDVVASGSALSQADLDHYSWQMFVALNWPATETGAVPPTMSSLPENPRVWETYIDPTTLLELNSGFSVRTNEPFRLPRYFNSDLFLQAASSLPVVDRNQNFFVNEMLFNRTVADFVIANGLTTTSGFESYAETHDEVVLPDGSIEIKAGWYLLPDDATAETKSRYYTTFGDVSVSADDSENGEAFVIEDVTLALIGMHITHKTPSRADWTWSTFEHVDLYEGDEPLIDSGVEGAASANRTPLEISSGESPESYLWQDPSAGLATAGLYERSLVARTPNEMDYPDAVNTHWRAIVPPPWSNYRLVTTQWVDDEGNPQPQNDDGYSVSRNVAFESYLLGDQTLADQFPGTEVSDACTEPGDGSTREAIIEQVENYDEYPHGVTYTDTWSTCVVCHQVALYKFGTNDDDVILTDYSLTFEKLMPQIECSDD